MSFLTVLDIFNYGLVLLYGLFLSVSIAGGWKTRRQKQLILLLCPFFLVIQIPFWLIWDVDTAKKLYPLIVHLPLTLILIFALKKPVGVSIVSVLIAYLCCQMPRWVSLFVMAVTHSALAGEISYTVSIFPIFFLLYRWFVRPAHNAMTGSLQTLLLFGSLPAVYYVFDYATAVYADVLRLDTQAIFEFVPTALVVFYVLFLAAFHVQEQKRMRAEMQQ